MLRLVAPLTDAFAAASGAGIRRAAAVARGGVRVRRPTKPIGGSVINIRPKPLPPRIVIGPQAVVDGSLVFEHPVTLYVHRSARTGAIQGATAIAFDTPTAPRDP